MDGFKSCQKYFTTTRTTLLLVVIFSEAKFKLVPVSGWPSGRINCKYNHLNSTEEKIEIDIVDFFMGNINVCQAELKLKLQLGLSWL